MPPKKNVKIPPRALKRGTMLWNKEFTEGIAADMADWADPAFMKMFMEFCYGGLYDRNVLPQKTRELCAVAACVMANANPQLRTHVQAAWNCGSSKREIMEVILQMATYCGMPYMLQAARTANDIFPSLKRGKKAGELPPAIKAKLTKAKKAAGAKGKSGARKK